MRVSQICKITQKYPHTSRNRKDGSVFICHLSLKKNELSLKKNELSLKTNELSLKTNEHGYLSLKTIHLSLKTIHLSLKTNSAFLQERLSTVFHFNTRMTLG